MKIRPLITIAISLLTISVAGFSVAADSAPTWQNLAGHPVLNQLTNNPAVGNERQFLKVRDINNPAGQRSIVVQPGQELAVTAYFDNAAKKPSQAAKNTKIRFNVPNGQAKDFTLSAYLSANNTEPKSLSDAVTIKSNQPVKLASEAGSIRLWNKIWRGQQLSDSALTSGTQLGYKKLDGNIPGGPAYSGYVTFKIRVIGSGSATTVPNTGPGDVIGLFAGASAAGTAFHMMRTSRRRR